MAHRLRPACAPRGVPPRLGVTDHHLVAAANEVSSQAHAPENAHGRWCALAVSTIDDSHLWSECYLALCERRPGREPRQRMRVHPLGLRPEVRLLVCLTGLLIATGVLTGALAWCWTQTACLTSLRPSMRLPVGDSAHAMWRLMLHGGWSTPRRAFPTAAERSAAPEAWAYAVVAVSVTVLTGRRGWLLARRVAGWRAGSPLGKDQRTSGGVPSSADGSGSGRGRTGRPTAAMG